MPSILGRETETKGHPTNKAKIGGYKLGNKGKLQLRYYLESQGFYWKASTRLPMLLIILLPSSGLAQEMVRP